MPFKQVREKKAPAAPKTGNSEPAVTPGQATLDGMNAFVNGANGAGHGGGVDDAEDGAADPNAQLEIETRARTGSSTEGQNGWSGSRDVEMT